MSQFLVINVIQFNREKKYAEIEWKEEKYKYVARFATDRQSKLDVKRFFNVDFAFGIRVWNLIIGLRDFDRFDWNINDMYRIIIQFSSMLSWDK